MKIKYIIPALILSLLSVSCSQSFEEMNIDPGRVTSIDDSYLFCNAVQYTFGSVQNERKMQLFFGAQYSHFYIVPHNTARPHDQYKDFLYTDDYYEVLSHTFTNPIKLANKVITMTSEGESKNDLRNAMAKVLAVCNFTRITDLYGDIPFTEGGWGDLGKLSPKYDPQEFIYKTMMDTLKRAVQIIKNGDPEKGYEGFDPLYENHLEYWARFANSMRLRLAIRSRFADPEFAEKTIKECLQEDLIISNEQNAQLYSLNDAYHYNQWSGTWEIYPWKMSKYLVDWLKGSNDPRLESWVKPSSSGELKGAPNGLNENSLSKIKWTEISDPTNKLHTGDMPVFFLAAAEVHFNLAETELMFNGSDANKYYQDGIRLAMSSWKISETDIDEFINNEPEATLFGDKENMLRQIGTQKWLSLMTNFTEAYSEIRRLGYPIIPKRTDEELLDLGVTDGYLPKRFLYPPEEISLNEKNANEAIERQGPNLITTPIWWDVRDVE
jgi:hypothetical protein